MWCVCDDDVQNESVPVVERARVACAEAERGKFHYLNANYAPRRFNGQAFLNLLEWTGERKPLH